jgi:hypothetical protein
MGVDPVRPVDECPTLRELFALFVAVHDGCLPNAVELRDHHLDVLLDYGIALRIRCLDDRSYPVEMWITERCGADGGNSFNTVLLSSEIRERPAVSQFSCHAGSVSLKANPINLLLSQDPPVLSNGIPSSVVVVAAEILTAAAAEMAARAVPLSTNGVPVSLLASMLEHRILSS